MLKKERIKIGWAEADITPAEKCELYGQYYQRVSKGVHSHLGATILAMKSESGEQTVMISIDLANFQPEFLDALRKKIKRLVPGIIPEKIMMSATHIHSAPAVKYEINWLTPLPRTLKIKDYREFVLSRVADAVRRAWESLSRGAICATRDHAVIGHCRRAVFANGSAEMYGDTSRDDFMELEGNEDSTVELLFTYDEKKNTTGVIVNAACPSQVMEATYLVSSDFMGELRRLLKTRFGDGFHVLCQISAAGDQSPRDLVRNRNANFWNARGVAILGQRLADAVFKAHENIENKEICDKIAMAHRVRTITLPKRFPEYRELILAEKEVARLEAIMSLKKAFAAFTAQAKRNEKIPGRPGPYDSKLHHYVLIRNAEAVIKRSAEQTKSPDFEMELHTLRMGDAAFCSNPFELFLDYGLRIKARSRARQTFVVQLCCGSGAYLPTAKAEKHGGYGGLIVNGVVGSEGGKKLVDETVNELNSLF
ncbi:MAG: hypothetical protein ABIH24_02475 [Verrucomicrobiota bacterium]